MHPLRLWDTQTRWGRKVHLAAKTGAPTATPCITDLAAACNQGTLHARIAWAQPSDCPLQQAMAMKSPFADDESRLARARDDGSKCSNR